MVRPQKFLSELCEGETISGMGLLLGEAIHRSSGLPYPRRVPYIESTCYVKTTSLPDWTLEYWVRPQLAPELWSVRLSEEDIKKLQKMLNFLPLEDLVTGVVEKIKDKYGLCGLKTWIGEDPDAHGDLLIVEISVRANRKKAIELWKKISTIIRNEVDEKLGERSEEYQRKLLIRVVPDR